MSNKILSLAKEFIAVKSIPKNPENLEKVLKIASDNLKGFTIEHFKKNGSKSILVYASQKRPKRFKVLLNGHLDVVPGKESQYTPKINGDQLFGVGSLDMKSSVACLITTFKELARKVNYPLGLQIVTDEEIGGFDGTKHQVDSGVRSDFVIAGESTNFNIAHKAKGVLWLKISCSGKTAHGAYPWRGQNAVLKMNNFVNILYKKFPVPTQEDHGTTVNLSKIETDNQSFNKIPDNCSVSLDIRYAPEDAKSILSIIKKLLPTHFKMEVVVNEPEMFVDKNNPYLKLLQKSAEKITKKKIVLYQANGSSDARHFTRVNCNGIEIGPVGGGIGTDDEWIDIPSLKTYCKILKDFLLSV